MGLEANQNQTRKNFSDNESVIEPDLTFFDTDEPLEVLIRWLEDAKAVGVDKPDAMNIATISKEGKPRNRMVLMRHVTNHEIGFFTNLSSDKSKEIIDNPNVSATLWWPKMERQIRVQGVASPMDRDIVEAYFKTRPRNSQIAAWASRQSQPLESMSFLNGKFQEAERKFGDGEIPIPEFWGGYTISVDRIEFWLGQPFRLHERVVFSKHKTGWNLSRLFP